MCSQEPATLDEWLQLESYLSGYLAVEFGRQALELLVGGVSPGLIGFRKGLFFEQPVEFGAGVCSQISSVRFC